MNLQYKTGYPYAVSNVSYPSIGLPMFPNGYPDINTSIVKYIPQEPNTRLKDYFRIDLNYTMEKKLKHGSRIWQFSLLNVTGHKTHIAFIETIVDSIRHLYLYHLCRHSLIQDIFNKHITK